MPLRVIPSAEDGLLNDSVIETLRTAVQAKGRAVLLLPSSAQALDVQRSLASLSGLAMAVRTTTISDWAKECWEVWGDGRALADSLTLNVLARQVIMDASDEERGTIRLSAGVVKLVARLVDQALPWLPLDECGRVLERRCAQQGLTHAETLLVGLAGALGRRLDDYGLVSRARAYVDLPRLCAETGAEVAPIVLAGHDRLIARERELVAALLERGVDVGLAIRPWWGAASGRMPFVVEQLGLQAQDCDVVRKRTAEGGTGGDRGIPFVLEPHANRDEHLSGLLRAIFRETLPSAGDGPVELLLATGPVAEAELVARRVCELVRESRGGQGGPVVVATPDVTRARRELLPKLAARGLRVRMQWPRSLRDTTAMQAFLSFARTVARLVELDKDWPEPVPGLDGMVPQLGAMDWWPPRELVDFLMSDVAHMTPARTWSLDARWRGNRLLTPGQVLENLQAERDVSPAVARATAELLRGRMGSAASKLLAPYVCGAEPPRGDAADEARAVLQAVLRIAGALRELGVTADPSVDGAVSLQELVSLCEWAADGMRMAGRLEMGVPDGGVEVLLMDLGEAGQLRPASAYALVVAGCTTAEQPVGQRESLLETLLAELEIEPVVDAMEAARSSFHALLSVPRKKVLFEYALSDDDGKETYPSVMLSEALAVYGIVLGSKDEAESPEAHGVVVRRRVETDLSKNRSLCGERPKKLKQDEPLPAGRLTDSSQRLVFVPQEGRAPVQGGKPVLSASQIETYLDCPYKWFSLRRLRLGNVDAGHGGMEMGTFAHRVLEKTHGRLYLRALDADTPEFDEEALRELGEVHLTEHVAGSRVEESNLEAAQTMLGTEFDLHQQHMYMVKTPRLAQQLLVAHDSAQRAQERQLKEDLLGVLEYEKGILQGFEPRLFEWSFGRHGDLVEYAGAYLTGTVDRIDVSPSGLAVIVDYKHKSPIGFAAEYDALQDGVLDGVRLPNRVQSLIYVQVVRRAFAGRLRLVGTVYLATKSPYALAGCADENVADLVFGRITSKREERVCVPSTPEGEPGMEELLCKTEELVAEQVRQMMAGNVEARPRDRRSCDFCPVSQCERRIAR